MDWRKRLCSDLSSSGFIFRSGFATSLRPNWGQTPHYYWSRPFFSLIVGVFFLFLYVWIQQRVQLSWTQTGTLGRRQTASLSWPFTPTQTAVAAGVEVWETVTPTARGAQGVRRTHTPTVYPAVWWYYHRHDAWQVTFTVDGWLQCCVCLWFWLPKNLCIQ